MQLSPDCIRLAFIQAGGGATTDDGWIHRKTVPYIIVAQAVEGSYDLEILGREKITLAPGEAFLTAPGLPLAITHHCDPRSGVMRMRWIHFNFNVFNAIGLASLVKLPLRIETNMADIFGDISDRIVTLQDSVPRTLHNGVMINALAFEVLAALLDFLAGRGLYLEYDPGMERLFPALEYAGRHLALPLEVDDLARRANLSVPRFHVEFKKYFGETPIDHLRRLRLSRACDLLRGTVMSLEEIAETTGFCSQFHFSREFKKFYGEPPSTYRRTMRSGFAL